MSRLGAYRFAGGLAVVTGAASGIGEQLALGLARRGSSLVLLDRDADRLQRAARNVRRDYPQVEVDTLVVDLADAAALTDAAERILADHPRITLLINNAGVAMQGRFEQLALSEFDTVMAINFRAPVALTHHLLPALRRSPGSHLVNVSSVFGLMAPAGQSAYSSSKFAVRGFSEVLRAELARHQIGVTTVHPGGIRTRIAETAMRGTAVSDRESEAGRRTALRLLTYPPEKAAEEILDAVVHRRPRVLVSWSAKLPDLLVRLMPARYSLVLAAVQDLQRRRRRHRRPGRTPQAARSTAGGSAMSGSAAGDRWVTAGGARIRYRLHGDPSLPPVLLLHGIGRSLEDWTEQEERLADDFHLVSMDLPGFGLSEPTPGPITLRGVAQTVLAVLDALDLGSRSRPIHVVGNSLGGAVALQLLALDHERVRSLILVSSAGFGAEVAVALRLLAVPGLGRRLLRHPDAALALRNERAIFVNRALVTPERVALAVRLAQQPHHARVLLETARHLGTVRGVRPRWRRELLAAVSGHPKSTLILWGDRDLILPSHHLAAAREELPHAQFHEFARTGHMPQIERADDFADLVRTFLRSADAVGGIDPH